MKVFYKQIEWLNNTDLRDASASKTRRNYNFNGNIQLILLHCGLSVFQLWKKLLRRQTFSSRLVRAGERKAVSNLFRFCSKLLLELSAEHLLEQSAEKSTGTRLARKAKHAWAAKIQTFQVFDDKMLVIIKRNKPPFNLNDEQKQEKKKPEIQWPEIFDAKGRVFDPLQ